MPRAKCLMRSNSACFDGCSKPAIMQCMTYHIWCYCQGQLHFTTSVRCMWHFVTNPMLVVVPGWRTEIICQSHISLLLNKLLTNFHTWVWKFHNWDLWRHWSTRPKLGATWLFAHDPALPKWSGHWLRCIAEQKPRYTRIAKKVCAQIGKKGTHIWSSEKKLILGDDLVTIGGPCDVVRVRAVTYGFWCEPRRPRTTYQY